MSTILVTGGTGMVGKHLQKILPNAHYVGSNDGDLNDETELIYILAKYFHTPKEGDRIIHLAAKVGGLQDNMNNPASFYDQNIMMNTMLVQQAHRYGVKRFTAILSTCIYPDVVDEYPMVESDMHLGPPPQGNFSYAYAKRAMAVQIDAYNKQHGTKYNYLIPCNLYSEYDNFDNSVKMHFITALIKKIIDSDGTINLLGTGKPLRQFMYAGDLAKIIKDVVDKDITDNFNIAPDWNYSIKEMAEIALNCLGKEDIKINWERPEMDGQYRKDVDASKLKNVLKNISFTELKDGIRKVYEGINNRN